jgi:DNA invertase Pin-like site-specific DNA recombinase
MARQQAGAVEAAAIYCRISLDRAGEGLGVKRQEQLCRELADARGWRVGEVYIDNDRSAYGRKPRPGYMRMLADIEAGARDAVICVDLDRLTRRPAELEEFIEIADRHKIALANVSGDTDLSTSDGRFRARIMGIVARQESEKKGERVSREAAQAARDGKPRGSRRPFGWNDDKVTVCHEEAELIRHAVDLVLDGVTVMSIANAWNDKGIPTAQGAPNGWSTSTVAGILRNPRLAGLRTYKGEIVAEGAWEPILDRATFDRLQAKIRRGSRPGRSPSRLLTSIARCGKCGAPMWSSLRSDTKTPGVARYRCVKRPGAPGCGRTTILAEPLDQCITDAVVFRLSSKAVARSLSRPVKRPNSDADLEQIERDLELLAADYGAGTITRREWLTAREQLEQRRATAQRLVDETNGTTALAPFRNGNVRNAWGALDADRRRAVLNALIDRVVVKPATAPGRFTPDRIDVEWRV